MKRIFVDLEGTQTLIDLTAEEIAEMNSRVAPPPRPRSVDKRRLMVALLRLNLLDSIETAVAQAGGEAEIEWRYGTTIQEDYPLVQSLILGLGWTPEVIDGIFDLAFSLD